MKMSLPGGLVYAGLIFTVLSTTLHAQPLTPAQLSRDMQLHGAISVVQNLDHSGRFDTVLDRIASGKTSWVQLALAISKGTDGGTSAGLSVALARALPTNPAAVLAVLDDGPVLGASVICGVPFMEPTHQEVTAYLNEAIPAVTRVNESVRLPQRAACLRALRQVQMNPISHE